MRYIVPILSGKTPLAFFSIIISFFACTRYPSHFFYSHQRVSMTHELKFDNIRWETTDNPSIMTTVLDIAINQLMPGDIKSVFINKNGVEIPAGYLNWGRDNLYKYEVYNSRIDIYWKTENSFIPDADQVTVIIKIGI